MENHKISVVIPVFNKFAFTKSCINDLLRLPNYQVEIIVVDNASTDTTQVELQKLCEQHLNIHYIRNDINLGFGKASNIGYTSATNEVICFLNNDIRIKNDGWLQTLIDAIEDDCLIGPTGGMIDIKNNFQFLYETNDKNKPFNYMSGWCLAANKRTWSKLTLPREDDPIIQVFDEDFFCFFEDTDLSFRATKQNIKFKLIDIPVVHFGHISSSQLNTSKLYNTSRPIFINKWKGKL